MVRGIDSVKSKKKPWKNKIERDIILHRDIAEAYTQGGKAIGDVVKQRYKKKKNKA